MMNFKQLWEDISWETEYRIKNIHNIYRDIINGICNVIRYIPAVWSDYDFESHSIYRMLYYKLKYQEEFFMSDRPWCVGAKSRGRQIRLAKCLAKRLWDDNHLSNALEEHYVEYPMRPFETEPEYDKEGKIKWYRHIDESTEEENQSFRRCAEHCCYMEKQDRELLFKILNKHIRDWWD